MTCRRKSRKLGLGACRQFAVEGLFRHIPTSIEWIERVSEAIIKRRSRGISSAIHFSSGAGSPASDIDSADQERYRKKHLPRSMDEPRRVYSAEPHRRRRSSSSHPTNPSQHPSRPPCEHKAPRSGKRPGVADRACPPLRKMGRKAQGGFRSVAFLSRLKKPRKAEKRPMDQGMCSLLSNHHSPVSKAQAAISSSSPTAR